MTLARCPDCRQLIPRPGGSAGAAPAHCPACGLALRAEAAGALAARIKARAETALRCSWPPLRAPRVRVASEPER